MVILDYTATSDSSGNQKGTRGSTISLVQPLMFDDRRLRQFRVNRVILSPEIPNVYNYGGFNNTVIAISGDGGTQWSSIQMTDGIYQLSMIQDTITNAFSQLGILDPNATNVPIVVSYNPATRQVYTSIDSTALTAGHQACVDYGITPFYQLLGYNSAINSKFIADGIYVAQLPPNLDIQGTSILVTCSVIQGARYRNGVFSNVIARVPIVQSAGQIEIVFPSGNTGFISDWVTANIPASVMNYAVDFVSELTGKSIVFLYGNATLELELRDI